jgi:hypothetical protein
VAINTSRCSIRVRSTLHGVERVEVADDCVVTCVPVLSLNTDMKLIMVSRVAPPPGANAIHSVTTSTDASLGTGFRYSEKPASSSSL